MGILDLVNKTQSSLMARDNFASENISFYSFSSNQTTEAKAIISYGDFRKLDSAKDTISDEISFMMVQIDVIPNHRDKVTYNGIEWYVVDFKQSGNNFYDIYCERNKRHSNTSRSARK